MTNRIDATRAAAIRDLVVTGALALVAIRLGVNRYSEKPDTRKDILCLCCGGQYRPDGEPPNYTAALVCQSCARSAREYEDEHGVIFPQDVDAEAHIQRQQRTREWLANPANSLPYAIRESDRIREMALAERAERLAAEDAPEAPNAPEETATAPVTGEAPRGGGFLSSILGGGR